MKSRSGLKTIGFWTTRVVSKLFTQVELCKSTLQDDHIPEDAMDLAAPMASPTVSVSFLFILTKLVNRDGPDESSLMKMPA